MKKTKSRWVLFGSVAVALLLIAVSVFGVDGKGALSAGQIKQGLDLQGGVSIIYEADVPNPTTEEMNSALKLIRERLDRRGFTEATVSTSMGRRILVDIPGVTDPETAVREIGQTAQIFFEDDNGETILTGYEHVANAYKSAQQTQGSVVEYVVVLEFTSEGKAIFAEATANNVGKPIHIILDGRRISSPVVQTTITDGTAIISGGNMTAEYTEELAQLIKAGSLPFNLSVINVNVVGARLGANSLEKSLTGGLIGAVLVLLFMAVMYKFSGLAADLALLIYIGLELLVLNILGITLTLPGIAGIILSVGMAVDANVIIFERLKEEIENRREMKYALDAAFKSAFSAILDGNVTTLISAVVLFWLGTGPIKGFAQTLAIGIIISMFTALVVTRLIMRAMIGGISKDKKFYTPTIKFTFVAAKEVSE